MEPRVIMSLCTVYHVKKRMEEGGRGVFETEKVREREKLCPYMECMQKEQKNHVTERIRRNIRRIGRRWRKMEKKM